MDTTLIEQSFVSYQRIAEHLRTIEKAMHGHDSNSIIILSQQLLQLQEQVKANDTAILKMVSTNPAIRHEPLLMKLIDLMRQIHQNNKRVTVQLRSIMVVHRDELMKLKRGNTALQGYRPATQHTGRRISVSN
ncbi:MAG: hypothetical protein AB7U29_13320 [Desulfobulbus sp.]